MGLGRGPVEMGHPRGGRVGHRYGDANRGRFRGRLSLGNRPPGEKWPLSAAVSGMAMIDGLLRRVFWRVVGDH